MQNIRCLDMEAPAQHVGSNRKGVPGIRGEPERRQLACGQPLMLHQASDALLAGPYSAGAQRRMNRGPP